MGTIPPGPAPNPPGTPGNPWGCGGKGQQPCPARPAGITSVSGAMPQDDPDNPAYSHNEMLAHGAKCYAAGREDELGKVAQTLTDEPTGDESNAQE